MNDTSSFNKLWVIESLSERELKTGTMLMENQLKTALQVHTDLVVDFEQPITKTDLLDLMFKIRNEMTEQGHILIINYWRRSKNAEY